MSTFSNSLTLRCAFIWKFFVGNPWSECSLSRDEPLFQSAEAQCSVDSVFLCVSFTLW